MLQFNLSIAGNLFNGLFNRLFKIVVFLLVVVEYQQDVKAERNHSAGCFPLPPPPPPPAPPPKPSAVFRFLLNGHISFNLRYKKEYCSFGARLSMMVVWCVWLTQIPSEWVQRVDEAKVVQSGTFSQPVSECVPGNRVKQLAITPLTHNTLINPLPS